MNSFLLLIPVLPLIAAIVTALLGPRILGRHSHWPTLVALIVSAVLSGLLLAEVRQTGEAVEVSLWRWVDLPAVETHPPLPPTVDMPAVSQGGIRDFTIEIVLRADTLTAVMLAMVTFVSSLVAIYSVGYMQGDRSYWRFFTYVSLFVFSMTMLVSVCNFLLVYAFWEGVGVCSYLLIGFWYDKPAAAAAGKKAFLVNRVGDFGFAFALFFIWTTYGTLNFYDTDRPTDSSAAVTEEAPLSEVQGVPGMLGEERLSNEGYVKGPVALTICLLLMMGAAGKSAQVPLHVWLADAMEGPTPVSALIHAATMVTAGVYLVARCTPLFHASPEAQLVVALIGGTTALLAAIIALTQFDLKRVLAYSTMSQLGYMFLALGTGTATGIYSGMFHLFTHAFFKALLFLGAGSVMHAMGNVIDMRRMGGLRRRLPITHATFAIGAIALAGLFPFSGFWSKDAIIAAVHDRAHGQYASIYHGLYYLSIVAAFLTAFYTFRAFFLVFYGREVIPAQAGDHAHESPKWMTLPLIVLALCAAGVGFLFREPFSAGAASWLMKTPSLAIFSHSAAHVDHHAHSMIALISNLVALAGVGCAAFMYLGHQREARLLQSLLSFDWLTKMADLQWWQRVQSALKMKEIRTAARVVYLDWLVVMVGYLLLLLVVVLMAPILLGYYVSPYRLSRDKFYFDEIYDALLTRPLKAAASVAYAFDRWVIDGTVNLLGRLPIVLGGMMRSLQMGFIPFYALAMVLSMLILMVAGLIWAI